jgi:threonine/homoserine/homoserine lactone efflux protein
MDILEFVITIVLLTASGALAPGPLFFATISHGTKHGAKTGIIFSIAHTLVEFSLIMLFALGLITIASEPFVKNIVGIMGGIVLVAFGTIQIYKSIISKTEDLKKPRSSYRHLFFIGIAFTGLNPFFILWWLTVGAQLIIMALQFAALLGVIFMFICHVWMDYIWLTGVAFLSKRGTKVMDLKWYKPLMIIFGAVLIYFGASFILGAAGIYI